MAASLAATAVHAATMLITPTFGGSTGFAVTGADSAQYDTYTTSYEPSSSYTSTSTGPITILSYYSPNPVYLGGHRVFFKLGDVTLGMLQYGVSTQAYNAAKGRHTLVREVLGDLHGRVQSGRASGGHGGRHGGAGERRLCAAGVRGGAGPHDDGPLHGCRRAVRRTRTRQLGVDDRRLRRGRGNPAPPGPIARGLVRRIPRWAAAMKPPPATFRMPSPPISRKGRRISIGPCSGPGPG